jgi:ABC-2 type transport system ATP-binding protein
MYFGALFGYAAAERRRRAAHLLDQVGIAGERRLQLRKFSKGMLQRVGIAQALLNDPDVVIFDEPMSGLDPLGRRDVRALILGLRDRGATVFFSSHVLSDAEALCSRVAILARGRLVASGGLSEMLAFEASGWELVVDGVRDQGTLTAVGGIRRVVPIGEGRYALELPLEPAPERLMGALAASGARLISLNPIRPTLEDLFVEQVTSTAAMATRRGLEDDEARVES